jgi:hypothetical protein
LPEDQITPFDFHLGGDRYKQVGSKCGFNYSFVQIIILSIAILIFTVEENKNHSYEIVMDVSDGSKSDDFDLEEWEVISCRIRSHAMALKTGLMSSH